MNPRNTKLPSRLITADQLAEEHLPGHAGRTIRRWAVDGLIPCYRINKKTVLFAAEEVMRAISKRREHSTHEINVGEVTP